MSASGGGTRLWHSPLWLMRLWAVLAALALTIMEVTVAALWYQAIFDLSQPLWIEIFAIIFIIYTGSFIALRAMEALHWSMSARRSVFLLWILISAFTSLKLLIYPTANLVLIDLLAAPIRFIARADVSGESFFHLIFVILFAWRGVSIARSPVTTPDVHASFQFGLVILLLYGMIYAPLHPMEAILGLYGFLYFGLIAMSMARIANMSETRGGRIPRFGTGWVVSILLAATAVVALAIATGWLASGKLVELLAFGLLIIIAILTALVLIILSPLLSYLAELFTMLSDLIAELLERLRTLPIGRQLDQFISVVNDILEKVTPYLLAGRGIFLLTILAVTMMLVLLTLYLRKNRLRLIEEEESETTEQSENGSFLQKWVQKILQDARRLRLRGPAQLLAAARIRQIYRQLMSLSQKLGAARSPSTTPLEFLPVLTALFPEDEEGLGRITGAYLKVRYGEYPETASEVDQVLAAWESVRRQGQKALVTRRRSKKQAAG